MAVEDNGSLFPEIRRVGKLSNEGIFIFNAAEERFVFLNASMSRIFEIDKKLLMDEPHVALRPIPEEDLDYLRLRFSELLSNGSIEDVQLRIKFNNIDKSLSVNAYVASDKLHVIGFVKNVTNSKQYEEYLSNYGARKDALLDMVAQNLSTPLNLSKFTVDLIEKAVREKKYHKLNAHIKLMREVTSESITVIDKFLQEEHLESPMVDPRITRFDLVAKIMIVLEKLKEAHPDKQFRVDADAKQVFVQTDDLKFFQIVHNLLSNAIKFTRPNGVIETIVKTFHSTVQIIVKDDGVGIPRDIQPYIFEKYTRAARPGLKGEISNGIGLYVIKQLTDLLGGEITFESEENAGTKFTLALPRETGG